MHTKKKSTYKPINIFSNSLQIDMIITSVLSIDISRHKIDRNVFNHLGHRLMAKVLLSLKLSLYSCANMCMIGQPWPSIYINTQTHTCLKKANGSCARHMRPPYIGGISLSMAVKKGTWTSLSSAIYFSDWSWIIIAAQPMIRW